MSSLCGPRCSGNALQHRDDLGGVVDRQRGLGDEGEIVGILRREGLGVFRGLDQRHRARRQLPERADHFRMMGMPDQEDFAAALEMDRGLAVHLGDQRAGRVQRERNCAPLASAGTDLGTPWAENTTGAVVLSGISASSSTKIAPFVFRLSTT
jgi:hypothetical protein